MSGLQGFAENAQTILESLDDPQLRDNEQLPRASVEVNLISA
jgi:hypothetical protein